MGHVTTKIAVKHNMEIAHRLYLQPGKCQAIHGHGMQVTMTLKGQVDEEGIFCGIDYSDLKKMFRQYIDETYDHHLLLNASDPFARPLHVIDSEGRMAKKQIFLPGLQALPGDPTTENLAKWIAEDMRELLQDKGIEELDITIWETNTNNASYTIWGTD